MGVVDLWNAGRDYVEDMIGGGETEPPESSGIEIQYNRDAETGEIIRPPADGEPNQAVGSTLATLGYAPGHIDMINELALSYDGMNAGSLRGTVMALQGDEELRNDVLDALNANDQELAHYAAQAFEQDPALLSQFEYMVRQEPDRLREVLPEMQENPELFHEYVRNNSVDPEAAAQANAEAGPGDIREQLSQVWNQVLSGEMQFADFLGGGVGAFLDQILGPLMGMVRDFTDSVNGFASQNLGPAGRDFVETIGLDPDRIIDVGADPDAPEKDRDKAPGQENEADQTREVSQAAYPVGPQ